MLKGWQTSNGDRQKRYVAYPARFPDIPKYMSEVCYKI